ncbi:MAG: nuclear transport factor 2 family protein [Steroidobacteraceae bacterium]
MLAIEQIRRLKARYFRCVDTKDWQGFGELFLPNAHFDISADLPGGVFEGVATIVRVASEGLRGAVSVHLGHSPEIDVTSELTAAAIWAMEDRIRWDDAAVAPLRSLHGFGHYHEVYERREERWQIRSLRLTRLRVDLVPK